MKCNENVLLCFKSDKDLQNWEKNDMSDFFKYSIRLGGHRYQIDDKIYKAAVMDCTLSHGYLPNDVYFINCFLDDCVSFKSMLNDYLSGNEIDYKQFDLICKHLKPAFWSDAVFIDEFTETAIGFFKSSMLEEL